MCRNVCGCETYPLLKTINRALGRLPGPGPDCYLDQERNDLDGVVIDSGDVGYAEEGGRGGDRCVEPLLKGHPKECNKYVICEFGVLREQSCPPELHFNKVIMIVKISPCLCRGGTRSYRDVFIPPFPAGYKMHRKISPQCKICPCGTLIITAPG